MTSMKIRPHESYGTEDNPVRFADPTPSPELHQEYERFETIEAAMQWFDMAARAFGPTIVTRESEFLKHDETTGVNESTQADVAGEAILRELEAHGIIIKTHSTSKTYYKRTRNGEADPSTSLQRHDVVSTMIITDSEGRTGGIYSIEARQHYPEHVYGDPVPTTPAYAEMTIDYLTEDETAYGQMTGATATFGESTKPMNHDEQEKFLNLASNAKSVIVSKLAIIDNEHHDRLRDFTTTA